MKDYYKILEINESASKETVEKVHKLLIKKYHPDLQPDENKKEAEEYMKVINEAYEVLTDPVKKQQYDSELKEYRMQEIIKEMKKAGKLNTDSIKRERQSNQNTQSNVSENQYVEVQETQNNNNPFNVTDEEIRRQAQVYYDELYNQYLYRNGYIREKQDPKDLLARIITLAIMIGIIFLLFKIPFTYNLIKQAIQSNEYLDIFFGGFFK